MDYKKILKHSPKIIFISFFIGLSFFLFRSSPEELISLIGIRSSYIVIFFLAFLGGLTTFTGIPCHPILAVFAAGRPHPILLGFATSLGVMLGDPLLIMSATTEAPSSQKK